MKVRRGKFSGAIGNEVYVDAKDGQIVRSRPRRSPRATPDRQRAWANLSRVASVWRTLFVRGWFKSEVLTLYRAPFQ